MCHGNAVAKIQASGGSFMKFSKRLLSLLLALVMTVGVMPAVGLVSAADATGQAEQSDTFMRVLHLDCGRKYFTKDWIIALLNEMASAGYTHLQLAFGNDGLRFLLDDMSVTADGTAYSSADVTAGIQAGNKAYYDAAIRMSSLRQKWMRSSLMRTA